jgi:hypothetical protein
MTPDLLPRHSESGHRDRARPAPADAVPPPWGPGGNRGTSGKRPAASDLYRARSPMAKQPPAGAFVDRQLGKATLLKPLKRGTRWTR